LPLRRRETKQPIKAYEPKERLTGASGNRERPDVNEYLVELHPLDALGRVFGSLCLSLPPPPALIVSTLRPGLWHAGSALSCSCCMLHRQFRLWLCRDFVLASDSRRASPISAGNSCHVPSRSLPPRRALKRALGRPCSQSLLFGHAGSRDRRAGLGRPRSHR
jgi:hypothetical protein